MSYPYYPKQRLIVNGVDLTEKFRLILVDGYTLPPPEPKRYTVDVPCADGVLDYTEALAGDVVYNNRTQEFEFYVIGDNSFMETKTKVMNFLHGRAYDYQLTMDPDYTYHGRFSVSSMTHSSYMQGIVGIIKIKIDADPYKFKKPVTLFFDISKGQYVRLESGRKMIQPKFEFSCPAIVAFKNERYEVPAGTYKFTNIWFEEGLNDIYIGKVGYQSSIPYNSADIISMSNFTYGELKQTYRIFELYDRNTSTTTKRATYADYAEDGENAKTYDDMKMLIPRLYLVDNNNSYPAYIQYEWRDL